ncbi:hypothetical protein J8L85_04080 [Maribacter sp. MMG018]|nr:hypothetical protein [Maribacter sp. MMG018]MBQ4913602.1 hypothetical protein [Maribacter sp. MMG018]
MESKTNNTKRKYHIKNKAFFWSLNKSTPNKREHSSENVKGEKKHKKKP